MMEITQIIKKGIITWSKKDYYKTNKKYLKENFRNYHYFVQKEYDNFINNMLLNYKYIMQIDYLFETIVKEFYEYNNKILNKNKKDKKSWEYKVSREVDSEFIKDYLTISPLKYESLSDLKEHMKKIVNIDYINTLKEEKILSNIKKIESKTESWKYNEENKNKKHPVIKFDDKLYLVNKLKKDFIQNNLTNEQHNKFNKNIYYIKYYFVHTNHDKKIFEKYNINFNNQIYDKYTLKLLNNEYNYIEDLNNIYKKIIENINLNIKMETIEKIKQYLSEPLKYSTNKTYSEYLKFNKSKVVPYDAFQNPVLIYAFTIANQNDRYIDEYEYSGPYGLLKFIYELPKEELEEIYFDTLYDFYKDKTELNLLKLVNGPNLEFEGNIINHEFTEAELKKPVFKQLYSQSEKPTISTDIEIIAPEPPEEPFKFPEPQISQHTSALFSQFYNKLSTIENTYINPSQQLTSIENMVKDLSTNYNLFNENMEIIPQQTPQKKHYIKRTWKPLEGNTIYITKEFKKTETSNRRFTSFKRFAFS